MGSGELWQCGSDDLLRALVESETRRRLEYAASLELIAELVARDVAAEVGYSSVVALLRDVVRLSPREITRRLGHAQAVTEVPVVSGGVVAAPLPVTAAVVTEGVLDVEHLDVITRALRNLPLHVSDADRQTAERTLVEAARGMDARTLAKVGHRVRAWLDEDGTPPVDRELVEPVNELHLSTRANGRTVFRGELDPEASALFAAVLSPLAKPRSSSDTGPDQRSPAERQGAALVEILRWTADSGELPSEGGEKPHILVTVPLDALRRSVGQGLLDGAGPLHPESARRLACDARIIPVVLGSRSEPVDIGRAGYTVPTALRRALVLRDGGCAFPGCDRAHRWCHSHHVRHWADGGGTDLDNLTLLCGQHHRLIHHSEWECAIVHGRAEFRPPAYVDRNQTPRHNILHLITRA